MWFGLISLFKEAFVALDYGIVSRAQKTGLIKLDYFNPRDFAKNKHGYVDERPYGGGPGMVMQVEPLMSAIAAAKEKSPKAKVIYLSPQGRPLKQADLSQFVQQEALIFICGRYEGIDQRVIDLAVDETWSIGDYVLSGGELAAMVMIDGITRLLPGALGHEESAVSDSFVEGLLDCPHYTRPEDYQGFRVPDVLLGGNHAQIKRWRLKQGLGHTWLYRPDLLEGRELAPEEQQLLAEFIEENGG